jgi:hypothetical protein
MREGNAGTKEGNNGKVTEERQERKSQVNGKMEKSQEKKKGKLSGEGLK